MKIKTIILLASLTGLILAAGYYIGGQNGLWTALIIAAIMNFGSYWLSDKIVLAMYRAKPVSENESPRFHQIVRRLAEKSGLPQPRLYIVNLPIPNAFATGRNPKHAAVAVTPALMEILDDEELEGVLAHELSHVKNRDILISSIAATLAGAISMLAQMAYFAAMFGGRRDNRNGGSPFGMLALVILTPLIATLLHLAISRSREFLADETGAKNSGKPAALARALEKIHAASLRRPLIAEPRYEATAHLFISNPFRPSLLMKLFSTHPPVEERVKRLSKMNIEKSG